MVKTSTLTYNDRLLPIGDTGQDQDVDSESDSSRQHECTNEFHKDDKLHREAECTTKISDKKKFE
jgi:hypothetical protein